MTIRLAAALLGLLLAAASPARAEAPRRVVTVNLRLDQLALRLAAPGQLVGLISYLARNPRIPRSWPTSRARHPHRPRALPNPSSISGPISTSSIRWPMPTSSDWCARPAWRSWELPWASLARGGGEVLIARMADALGRSEQGPRAGRGDARAAAPARASPDRRPRRRPPCCRPACARPARAAWMDELLGLTGYRNLAADLGISAYGRASLEAVLAGQPDLLDLRRRRPTPTRRAPPRSSTTRRSGPRAACSRIPGRCRSAISICAAPENSRRPAEAARGASVKTVLGRCWLSRCSSCRSRPVRAVAVAARQRGGMGDRARPSPAAAAELSALVGAALGS